MAEKTGSKPPKDETPEQAFSRLATRRVKKALKSIHLIGKLRGKGYKSTPAQVSKITGALDEAVERVEKALTATKPLDEPGFTV